MRALFRSVVIALAFLAFLHSTAIAQRDYRQLAKTKPQEARVAIAALAPEERAKVLRDLLGARQPPVRALAASVGRNFFDTGLVPDLQTALAREKDRATSDALGGALAYLLAYEKIALPGEELAALFPKEKTAGAAASRPGWIGAADVNVTVMDASGKPVAAADIFAYSDRFCARVPSDKSLQTDKNGRARLALARGKWTVLAFSKEEYQKDHPGRGVFIMARDLDLAESAKALTLQPTSEIAIAIEGKGTPEADAIHVIDPRLGFQVAFPSLGKSKKGKFALETTKGEALLLLAAGGLKGAKAWMAFEANAQAPASLNWSPMGDGVAAIALQPPTLLKGVDAAKITLRGYAFDATPIVVEAAPGGTIYAPPGQLEISYTVDAGKKRFVYGPAQYDLKAGQTVALPLDSPSTATIYHEHYKSFYGKDNVLAAGVLAWNSAGHFLTGVNDLKGRPLPAPIHVWRGDKEIAASPGPNGLLFRDQGAGVGAAWLPELVYELGFDLGPGVPKKMKGVGAIPVESQHIIVRGPAPLMDRMRRLAAGSELLYQKICAIHGEGPRWKKLGIEMKVTLPPTVGARAVGTPGGPADQMRIVTMLNGRWFESENIWALPHEMLHTFGFGHDDFMDVWSNAAIRATRSERIPDVCVLPPKAPIQERILVVLRGENSEAAANVVPWLVYGRCGLDPLRKYQDVEKEWKPAIQTHDVNDQETYCAILSQMAGTDLRDAYAAASIPIRPVAFAAACQSIAELRTASLTKTEPQGETTSGTMASAPAAKGPVTTDTLLSRALDGARAKGAVGVTELRQKIALVKQVPLNRARVRLYLRFGKTFDDLGAKDDAYAAYRQGQREAAKVSREYVDLCRRLATDAVMGKPLQLGHL